MKKNKYNQNQTNRTLSKCYSHLSPFDACWWFFTTNITYSLSVQITQKDNTQPSQWDNFLCLKLEIKRTQETVIQHLSHNHKVSAELLCVGSLHKENYPCGHAGGKQSGTNHASIYRNVILEPRIQTCASMVLLETLKQNIHKKMCAAGFASKCENKSWTTNWNCTGFALQVLGMSCWLYSMLHQ